jgi:methenyltetrahydromethanopterin cyclohydrolase
MRAGLDRINPNAVRIADEMSERASSLGLEVSILDCGARLIDAGVAAPGSHEGGRLYAEACLGGLARMAIAPFGLGPAVLSQVLIAVDQPLVACMASQYAGWQIKSGRFFAMGSGPARALSAAEPLFERYGMKTQSERSVLLLEAAALPPSEAAESVASRCGIPPSGLTLIAASTGSLVGATQIAARSVETALHKLMEIGFDLERIISGSGSCPIAPGSPDTLVAIGRTNDAMLYGASVTLWVHAEDSAVEAVLDRVPSSASREHGRLFHELMREHGDFYSIDPMLFSPARVTFVNSATGRLFSTGDPDEATLMRSFGIAGRT